MVYKQLTYEKRIEIKAYFKLSYNQSEIADLICVNKSTISRELKKNLGLRGYRTKQSQEKQMIERRMPEKYSFYRYRK